MIAKGTFRITMNAGPPHEEVDGVSLSRVTFDKRFSGGLEATSHVEMLGARTQVEGSAGYVALERVTGALDGRRGTFVLQHFGVMTRGVRSLTVAVVPDSGTGELRGLAGTLDIQIVEGTHHYAFDFTIE